MCHEILAERPWSLSEKLPTAETYNRLRQSVGWGLYALDVIQQSLPNSLYCVCAEMADVCIGMARIVGDGGMVYYIQDVIVLPAYQRLGIGTALMEAVMGYIAAHATQNSIVGLMAAKGKEPFYEKFGFTARPDARFGAGMTIFWG